MNDSTIKRKQQAFGYKLKAILSGCKRASFTLRKVIFYKAKA